MQRTASPHQAIPGADEAPARAQAGQDRQLATGEESPA